MFLRQASFCERFTSTQQDRTSSFGEYTFEYYFAVWTLFVCLGVVSQRPKDSFACAFLRERHKMDIAFLVLFLLSTHIEVPLLAHTSFVTSVSRCHRLPVHFLPSPACIWAVVHCRMTPPPLGYFLMYIHLNRNGGNCKCFVTGYLEKGRMHPNDAP